MSDIKILEEMSVSSDQFPVVGIGASAGGLDAVKKFLQGVSAKSGMAYVFIQHLSPDHESILPELLGKVSKIPVQQITDNIHLEPDHFYILPENRIVTATDGILKLDPLDDQHHKVKIIDVFFSSLAVVHQSYAIGVILSGTLTDGTLGLEVIKSYGGITFAQDTASAAFTGMPDSAISSGFVDFILPPQGIAKQLQTLNTILKQGQSDAGKLPSAEQEDEIFKQLLTVLRVRRGVDFTYYKTSTLKRRIVRRMALTNVGKAHDYLVYLRENQTEQDALYNDMLISVTNFFRDPPSFDQLCKVILPALVGQKTANEDIRIWIAGCATGEEAYSVAICLEEYLGAQASMRKVQIFATDISEIAIVKARAGIYRAADMDGVSDARRQQFFTKVDGKFQINKNIRERCVFAHHNLLKDPPFSKVDLISCRNVLIYMEPVLQKRVLNTFHYALNEQGFLMLGKSESIGKNTAIFSVYNQHYKIYRRNGARGRFMQVATQGSEKNLMNIDKGTRLESSKADIFKIADDIVLAKYAPAGVIVNEHHDITQFRGITDTWFAPAQGKATLNVFKMAREGLAFELRNLIHQAKKENVTVTKQNVVFVLNGQQHYTDITAVPLYTIDDLHYLLLFKTSAAQESDKMLAEPRKKKNGVADARDLRIEQLERELLQTRTDMRTVTEEQEAVNEELQSANEELLSGSEELQSLNEELETSKEEMQSTNEEITIVNNELLDRNEQLDNARNYTEGIINTIRDPLIILDKDLKVKRATGGFYTKFKVTKQETEGRYFYDLGNKQWDIPALRTLLESILPDKKVFADYEVSHVFPSIGRRLMCVNTRQLDNVNGEQLILLAIEDMTDQRKVEEGLAEVELLFKESKERLKVAVDAAGLGTWDLNPLSGELIWDHRCKEMFGLQSDDDIDQDRFLKHIYPDDLSLAAEMMAEALAGINDGEYEEEFRIVIAGKKNIKWIKFKGKAYLNTDGVAYRFVGTSLDITAQKLHDVATIELLKQKDDFISIASHELKTPITSLKGALQIIDKMKDDPSPLVLNKMIALSSRSLSKVSILIEDLLNASRFNQGELQMNKTNFLLSQLIDDSCHHIRAAGDYTILTTGDLDLHVYADVERIDQVVINFVNNAIKYAPEEKEILINIKQERGVAKVTVSDSGPGIPAEKIPHVFDRYYRVDNSGLQYSGLGLGLYICAEIIKKNDGTIGADSKLGVGSSFWFTLPLAK